MKLRRTPPPPQGKLNVTPLIDVVMCLIIFYLIVGKLAGDRNASVQLPSSGLGDVAGQGTGLVINVVKLDERASVVIDGAFVKDESLRELLRELGPKGEVTIRADRTLAYGEIGRIVDACREAGLTSVKLAAQKGSVR